MVKRNDTWWNFRFAQPAIRGGDPRSWFVKYQVDDRVDGYANYKIKGHTLDVKELIAATDDAYAAVWRFCLDMDLVTHVKAAGPCPGRAAAVDAGRPPSPSADAEGRLVAPDL